MFKRLTELVGRPELWEDTTERLLELIDTMNQTFNDYEEFQRRIHSEDEVKAFSKLLKSIIVIP